MKIGTTALTDAKKGSTQINKIYLGTTTIWSKTAIDTTKFEVYGTTYDGGVSFEITGSSLRYSINGGIYIPIASGTHTVALTTNIQIEGTNVSLFKCKSVSGKDWKTFTFRKSCSTLTSYYKMFYGNNKIDTFSVGGDFTTEYVTSFEYMFAYAYGITTLDLSEWDTSKVTNISNMFSAAHGITDLDLSAWDVSSVTNFSNMFAYMNGLTDLDLSGWDTSAGTIFSVMFSNTPDFNLDVSGWDIGTATFYGMFYNSDITSLDISDWDTSDVTNMNYMFYNCPDLICINADPLDTNSATTTSMFSAASLVHPSYAEQTALMGGSTYTYTSC